MSVFYFTDPKKLTGDGTPLVYELSCTTDISISSPASVTSSPVEDGSSITDNFYLSNRTASFSGIITNIRVAGMEATEVGVWLQSIKALRESKVLLTVVADTEVLQNCIITNLNISKTKEQGLSGWKANLSFQEVTISERARLVEIKEPKPAEKDQVEGKKSSSSSSVKQVGSEVAGTVTTDVIKGIYGFATGD